jgi:outer membrane protein OmpA-like peptidoglycan-associated protein
MRSRFAASFAAPLSSLLMLALLLGSGCKDKLDFSKYTTQAAELAQKYAPQLQELSKQLPDLAKRAADIPESVPGAKALKGLLAKNQGLVAQLQGAITGLSAKVAEQAKTGKQDEVKKLLDTTAAELENGVAAVRTDLGTATADLAKVEEAAKAAAAAATGAAKLPSGAELKGAADGAEARLVAFLNDNTKDLDKALWFNLDRTSFQSGKAELDLEKSQEQLANLIEILKAFPAAKLKVGGYTDNAGKAEDNKKLSQTRAEAVVAQLVSGGIDKSRLEAEGYGAEHAECPANDTDECKAKNRRIAVSVRAK